jgi:NADH:ubiquinone oxidoreductase subunit F (NADH-binding)
VIVNADEGDPGAFMDRALLEGNPHSILEGLIIGAYAIGAQEASSMCGRNTPWQWKTSTWPSSRPRPTAFWAKNILGSGFRFHRSRCTRGPAPLSAANRPP